MPGLLSAVPSSLQLIESAFQPAVDGELSCLVQGLLSEVPSSVLLIKSCAGLAFGLTCQALLSRAVYKIAGGELC
eukprot:1148535-Pelagomonas_calceolata.AAC.1